MTLDEFKTSLNLTEPPANLPACILALWHDRRGDWSRAHEVAQEVHDRSGAQVHAYLHRKEGDIGNALYWYRRAGVMPGSGSLDDEWDGLAELLLGER
jgi:hypothetical protein